MADKFEMVVSHYAHMRAHIFITCHFECIEPLSPYVLSKFPLTLSELKVDHVYLPDTTDIGRRQSTCIIVSEKVMHLAQP